MSDVQQLRQAALHLTTGALLGAAVVCLGIGLGQPFASSNAAKSPRVLPDLALTAAAPTVTAPTKEAPPTGTATSAITPAPQGPSSPVKPVARKVATQKKPARRELPASVIPTVSKNASSAVAKLLHRAGALLVRGKPRAALRLYLRATRLDKASADAFLGVALCRYELRQDRQARRVLARVLTLDPFHPQASILRGFIAQLSGQGAEARDWYERSLIHQDNEQLAQEIEQVLAQLPAATLPHTATALR